METVVPIFIGLIFVVVVGGILFAVVKGFSQWSYNNSQPVEAVPAKVVAKRTATSGGAGDSQRVHLVLRHVRDGGRGPARVLRQRPGVRAAGGERPAGALTHQGTRYKGFQRQRG